MNVTHVEILETDFEKIGTIVVKNPHHTRANSSFRKSEKNSTGTK